MNKLEKAEKALEVAEKLGLWDRMKAWFKRRRAKRKARRKAR